MKKLLFALSLVFAFAALASAQALTLEWGGRPVDADEVILCDSTSMQYGELECHMQVRNNTGNDLEIYVSKTVISEVAGTSNYFCWGDCYSDAVETSTSYVVVTAGNVSSESEFSGHYMPNDLLGETKVKYTFFVQNNPDMRVSFIARYVMGEVGVNSFDEIVLAIFPNPAKTLINIAFADESAKTVALYNMTGQKVLEQSVDGVSLSRIPVEELGAGMYFCSVLVDGKAVATKKVVIGE